MSEVIKERKEIEEQYKWDLTTLFESDEVWGKELERLDAMTEELAAYRGRLKSAPVIRRFLDAQTQMERLLSDLFAYASMRKSEDTRAEAAQNLYARIYRKYVQVSSALAFASPEILALPEEQLKEAAASDDLEPYRYNMEKLLREKAHMLSAEQEQLLAGFGEVFAAPREIAGNLQNADLTFADALDEKGEKREVSGANYILLQSSKDRTLRKNSFLSYYDGYRHHINTFAASYAGAVKGAVAEAAARKYASSREMYTAGENVPGSVYDNLIAAVRKFMPEMYRYVSLRKKLLGVDELHYYDLYAPLSDGVQKSYTYEQAQQMVLEAVKPLGEKYGEIVRQGYRDRWIDVFPNKGKQGGAYSSGTYDSNPFIMHNFTGTLDSVSTLAHEMGHSMHTWFSNHAQPPQYADYTLFVAEVASTVNENLMKIGRASCRERV